MGSCHERINRDLTLFCDFACFMCAATLVKMVMSACGSCDESVANRQMAVMCERCMAWFHASCVEMKDANTKALSFKLLVFVCRQCLIRNINE